MRDSKSGRSDIGERTRDLIELIEIEFNSSPLIKVIKHNRVPRYSSIKTDQAVWAMFFTNSEGYSIIPAVKVKVGSPLFEFFDQDVKRLLEQSNEPK